MKTAEEWIEQYITDNKIDYMNLTKAEQFLLTRQIPCTIRCWRIGESVDVKPGESCPECGQIYNLIGE